MLTYYFQTALRSFRAARALTGLMVLALALGIGACMTTLTVYHVLSGDPIPAKSRLLFNVTLDATTKGGGWKPGDEPTFQLTRFDAQALLRQHQGRRQVMMSGSNVSVQPATPGLKPFYTSARMTSADFFAMFDAPLRYGSGWTAADDEAAARVVVISDEINRKLFGGENSVGREIVVHRTAMRVAGVLAPWRPVPHYYDLTTGNYAKSEDVYLPFATAMELKISSSGNTNCWGNPGPGGSRDINAPCAWVQYWVELASPAEAPAYLQYLMQYSEEQRRAGRFERPPNAQLHNVIDWLVKSEVLPPDVRLQVWLAFGFLLVCLVNTVGLLLAKSLRRSSEIGVRRALGATRKAIFGQFLVEAGTLGAVGGLLGLALAWGGLWLVRQSPAEYASVAQMDWPMLGLTLGLALAASLVAGLMPAWQAARVMPALQLKTL